MLNEASVPSIGAFSYLGQIIMPVPQSRTIMKKVTKNRELGIIVGIVRIVNKRRDFSKIVISRMTQLGDSKLSGS